VSNNNVEAAKDTLTPTQNWDACSDAASAISMEEHSTIKGIHMKINWQKVKQVAKAILKIILRGSNDAIIHG
jgi:hypothetical protein